MITGKEYTEIETPALWVDLDIMESNISLLASYFKHAGINWRPHTKGIKVPAIAHKLIDAGVIGITCAKLSEAEVMVASGIKDILIAHQVVGPDKISRLVNLQRHADVMVSVDSLDNVKNISQAAVDLGVKVRVLVEVNIGMNRCGLTPGQAVVDLAKQIASLPGISFAGLMGYEGHLMGIEKFEEKKRCVEEAIGLLVQSAEMVRAAGLEVAIVSTGGSGDYSISALVPGVTENTGRWSSVYRCPVSQMGGRNAAFSFHLIHSR